MGVWKIEESVSELLLLASDRVDCLKILKQCGSEKRAAEKLAVRVLLKLMMCDERLTILYDSQGKPYLNDKTVELSISHTTGHAALFIHNTCLAGVDIETRGRKVKGLAPRFLSDEELEAIDKSREADALLLCWSGKESVYKIIGKAVVDFRVSLMVKPFVVSDSGSFMISQRDDHRQQMFNVGYQICHDYVMTWTKKEKECDAI